MRRHYLREWRKARGLTQMQLAELTGRSQSAITGYETQKKNMSMDAQADFARALNIEPYQLLRSPTDQEAAPPALERGDSLDELLAGADPDTRARAERMVRLLLEAVGHPNAKK